MSEEEKKAIEAIKQEIDRYKAIEMPKGVYVTDIKMLLNIVEKQQKEIEEWRNGIRINDNTIPKDAIRAKIQIYKDKKADIVGMLSNAERWNAKIEILQELLEENKC